LADILKGVVGGVGTFAFAWVFPSAIALFALYQVDLHRLGLDDAVGLSALGPAEQALVLGIAATGLGLVMNALSTPMYRLLEGYLFPRGLQRRLIVGEHRRRLRIRHEVRTTRGVQGALAQERAQRLPSAVRQTAPTRLGNALRSFETFGFDHYRLDSQLLWSELLAVVPDSLRKELEMARSSVDLFVAAVYLSAGVGIVTIASAFLLDSRPDLWTLLIGVIALGLSPVWYLSAVASTSYWDSTVRALIHLGRLPLAEAVGLTIPSTLDAERRMWAMFTRFAYYGTTVPSAFRLDEYRTRPPQVGDEVAAKAHESPAATNDGQGSG